jgi:hypothetical protein
MGCWDRECTTPTPGTITPARKRLGTKGGRTSRRASGSCGRIPDTPATASGQAKSLRIESRRTLCTAGLRSGASSCHVGSVADVELRQLRYLVAVADRGGFTAAAESLVMTQPALSRTVAALERATGVRPLDRTSRRLSSTICVPVAFARTGGPSSCLHDTPHTSGIVALRPTCHVPETLIYQALNDLRLSDVRCRCAARRRLPRAGGHWSAAGRFSRLPSSHLGRAPP